MTTTINPDKLAAFDDLTLDHGPHNSFASGHCAMEVVSWLADEGHTDAPQCASPIVRRYTIALNDRWSDQKRQQLKPYLLRMIGTGGDGKDGARETILREEVAALTVPWLKLAALDEEADALAQADTDEALRRALRAAADKSWKIRQARHVALRKEAGATVRAELAKRGEPAAVAAAVAVAVAVAAAAAVADAAAAAVAAAVAAADADADPWGSAYSAAKYAARKVYDEKIATSTDPKWVAIRELSQAQDGAALRILDRLIEAN